MSNIQYVHAVEVVTVQAKGNSLTKRNLAVVALNHAGGAVLEHIHTMTLGDVFNAVTITDRGAVISISNLDGTKINKSTLLIVDFGCGRTIKATKVPIQNKIAHVLAMGPGTKPRMVLVRDVDATENREVPLIDIIAGDENFSSEEYAGQAIEAIRKIFDG